MLSLWLLLTFHFLFHRLPVRFNTKCTLKCFETISVIVYAMFDALMSLFIHNSECLCVLFFLLLLLFTVHSSFPIHQPNNINQKQNENKLLKYILCINNGANIRRRIYTHDTRITNNIYKIPFSFSIYSSAFTCLCSISISFNLSRELMCDLSVRFGNMLKLARGSGE